MEMKVIAEVKKSSPFIGKIVDDIRLDWRVREYERLGAAMISIVTAKEFDGDKQWVAEARKITKLPILMKDFIAHEDHIKEAVDLGADYILLIAELLTAKELDELTFYAWKHRITPIVEIQSLYGVRILPYADTGYVLLNNRNLRTGQVNVLTALNLLPMVPSSKVIIAASGFDQQPKIIHVMRKLQEIDYILVGTGLMKSENLEETFKWLK